MASLVGIPPLTHRSHTYTVSRSQLTGREPYSVRVELKSAMVPVNLVSDIQDVGFDYDMSPAEVARNIVAGHLVLWTRELTVETAGRRRAAAAALTGAPGTGMR